MLTREQVEAIKKHCANNGAIDVGSAQMLELCNMALGYLAMQDAGYSKPSDVEAACVSAQREAFYKSAQVIDDNIIGYGAGGPSLRKRPRDDVQCLTYASAIRALSPSPGPWPRVPEGFVVVPEEPIDDQMEAGMKALHSFHKNYGDDLKAAYRAMIAASEVKP